MVVELAREAGRVERVERVRLDGERRLGRAEDRSGSCPRRGRERSTASAAGTSRSAARPATSQMKRRLDTNPPSARGSGSRRPAGLLTRGSLLRRLPGTWPVAFGGGASPLTAAGPSRTRTGFPYRSPCRAEPIMAPRWLSRGDFRSGRRSLVWAAVIFALLVDPVARDRPRRLGHGPAQGRAHDRVRDPRRCSSSARSAASCRRSRSGSPTRRPTSSTSTFVRGRHASPFDVAIDAAGLAIGLAPRPRLRRAVAA